MPDTDLAAPPARRGLLLTCSRCGMQEERTSRDSGRRLCRVCAAARLPVTWASLAMDETAPGYRIAREITRLRIPIVMTCALLRMGRSAAALRVLEQVEGSQVSIPPALRGALVPRQRRSSDIEWPDEEEVVGV